MIKVLRTNAENEDFIALVRLLDAELAERDGEDNLYYSQFNKIDDIKYAVVAYKNNTPVGCGAIKAFDEDAMEVKRMYVLPENRGEGIATLVLNALEEWAGELSCTRCVLETGHRQPEAIQLYKKNGYLVIPNYGQYEGIENSVCFEKKLGR